jgi:hypothetical protein
MKSILRVFWLLALLPVGLARGNVAETDGIASVVIPLRPYLKFQTTIAATINGVRGVFLFDTGEGLTSISPAFAKKVACRPWGRVSGFTMSGERLDSQHCDGLDLVVQGETLRAPSVIIVDIMKFIGPDRPVLDGAVGLDVFAGKVITIVPRKAIVIETQSTLVKRAARGREVPVRLVRDAEGLALAVDVAVPTSEGLAWMELDSGNGGSLVIANHIASLLGLPTDSGQPLDVNFRLANGIEVMGKARTRDLIMDGNISAQFLNQWELTLELKVGRAWLSPAGEPRDGQSQ